MFLGNGNNYLFDGLNIIDSICQGTGNLYLLDVTGIIINNFLLKNSTA